MNSLYEKECILSDTVIIQKVLNGEIALFATLIRKYNPLLYKIARTYCNSHEDAEDMMQESHFAAYLQLKNFRGDASYKTWITKILINNCYHNLQYRQSKFQEINIDLLEDRAREVQDNYDGHKKLVNKELGKLLEQSLQGLPLIYRSVFVLRKVQGFSVAETAEILEITPVNVKIRLNRAKALLRRYLESSYSVSEIYDFNLKYCNPLVEKVTSRIGESVFTKA